MILLSTTQNKHLILLLRYSDFNGIDTIKEHIEVIKQTGSCWWAKIGKTPSSSYIDKYMAVEPHIAFLYTAGSLHRCLINEVSDKRPTNNYPGYYDRDIFMKLEKTSSLFFRLSDIEQVELSVLDNYVVESSGKPAQHDLKKTISSYFLLQNKDEWIQPEKKSRPVKQTVQTPKQVSINTNYCVYQKDGVCGNKRCINYLYECERPSMCAKQKKK